MEWRNKSDTTGKIWWKTTTNRTERKENWKSKPDLRWLIQRKEHWWLRSKPTKQWRWWHRASWELLFRRVRRKTKDEGVDGERRGWGGGGGTGMIWLPWQNVQGHRSWNKSSDIARMKYTDTCKNKRDKENYIFSLAKLLKVKCSILLKNDSLDKAMHLNTI